MNLKLSYYLATLLCITVSNAQNLIDTSSWTVGSGSVNGFTIFGQPSENYRDFGVNPFGYQSVLWEARPDSASNADGGWDASYSTIDHTKTYRFILWLKKTNSNDGWSYFGCQKWQNTTDTNLYPHTVLRLNGDINTNPYFWVGDLPQLDKWYMLVGYVHGSTYNSNLSYGGIYDPLTGTKVQSITDYKSAITTTRLRLRSYLNADTNTSDRQYFYAPRMEEVNGDEPPIADLMGLNDNNTTNLYDLSGWTVGTGHTTDFYQYGHISRIEGENHVGEEVVLGKTSWQPTTSTVLSGGIYGHYKYINRTKTYRLSVWIKKTNSKDGKTYFGCYSREGAVHHTLNLNGSPTNNPYFWYGDLPKTNHWYLLVGYVHPNSYSGPHLGRIYDGVTAEPVIATSDKKFDDGAINLMLRSFLYATPNIDDEQYLYHPRMEEVNGSEWSLEQLLSVNPDSQLVFSYDNAGNQNQRFYCEEEGFCSPPAPTSRVIEEDGKVIIEETGVVVVEQKGIPLPGDDNEKIVEDDLNTEFKHSIYPNPTDSRVTIQLSGAGYNLTNSINIYSVTGALVQRIVLNNPISQLEIDLSDKPTGVYFIHMHFSNGTVVNEQIIKN